MIVDHDVRRKTMQFTPLKFQVPLAAGGIALMAFNYLQFAIPHEKGLIKMSDVAGAGLTFEQLWLYVPLISLMLAFSAINLGSTGVYLKQLVQWLANGDEYQRLVSGLPIQSVGIFVPVASISMTALVVMAPMQFFVPQLSSNLQAMMLPGLIFFMAMWLTIFSLEFKVLKIWMSRPVDFTNLNFVWLLDVFAFGLVSLTGTGIAAMSQSAQIASVAAVATMFSLTFGTFLLVAKLFYLLYLQMKADGLPKENFLPAYFILVPISCLYGFSFYRVAIYLQNHLLLDMKVFLFGMLVFSYAVAIVWGLFCVYLLSSYLLKVFWKSEFSPPQWSMV